jgi:hypothetical protein
MCAYAPSQLMCNLRTSKEQYVQHLKSVTIQSYDLHALAQALHNVNLCAATVPEGSGFNTWNLCNLQNKPP